MHRQHLSLLVAAAILTLTGCETQDPIAPRDGTAPLLGMSHAPVVVSTADIVDEFGTGSGVSGQATLTRSVDGLWLDIAAEGLVAGHAHTIWWVIFDNPQGCKVDGCGLDDLGRRSAQVTLVNGLGFVASAGVTNFATHLDRHDVGDRQVLLGDPAGVDNPYQAEVHAIVRSHGEAETDPDNLALQTSTVGGFCNLPPDESDGGCLDVGVVVFPTAPRPGKP